MTFVYIVASIYINGRRRQFTCGTYCRHKALYCIQRQNVLILTPNSQAKGATRTLTQIVAGDRTSPVVKNATG